MCAEKIQRLLMAIVLTISMVLFMEGYTQYGIFLQSFVILMIVVWAIKDFCPSLWGFTKIFGSCGKK
ncbi:MAG TPA: phosphoribosylaminoimidazole synthetase [Sulfuricurvum sp.]|nr:phosphoribosylaminoimidazole synthetase [Sulfuricurvum sp.]